MESSGVAGGFGQEAAARSLGWPVDFGAVSVFRPCPVAVACRRDQRGPACTQLPMSVSRGHRALGYVSVPPSLPAPPLWVCPGMGLCMGRYFHVFWLLGCVFIPGPLGRVQVWSVLLGVYFNAREPSRARPGLASCTFPNELLCLFWEFIVLEQTASNLRLIKNNK